MIVSMEEQFFEHLLLPLKITVTQEPDIGLPWWSSDKQSACQCRGHGFDPWSGKTPHAEEQLSLWASAAEAHAPWACALQQEKPLQWEARELQPEGSPLGLN